MGGFGRFEGVPGAEEDVRLEGLDVAVAKGHGADGVGDRLDADGETEAHAARLLRVAVVAVGIVDVAVGPVLALPCR